MITRFVRNTLSSSFVHKLRRKTNSAHTAFPITTALMIHWSDNLECEEAYAVSSRESGCGVGVGDSFFFFCINNNAKKCANDWDPSRCGQRNSHSHPINEFNKHSSINKQKKTIRKRKKSAKFQVFPTRTIQSEKSRASSA